MFSIFAWSLVASSSMMAVSSLYATVARFRSPPDAEDPCHAVTIGDILAVPTATHGMEKAMANALMKHGADRGHRRGGQQPACNVFVARSVLFKFLHLGGCRAL